jgi:predicted dehydrogenase
MTTVAIIGLGPMGKRHLQVIKSLGLELVAICDANTETLKSVGDEYGIGADHRFQSARQLFDEITPQCVIIATTAPSHCSLTSMAAEAGTKFILCEKPMATSLAECDAMIEVCLKHGAHLAINHQMRFIDQYVMSKEIVNSEEFGGFGSVTVLGGNFGMAMNGTHYFEMFRYLTDESPEEVTAWFSPETVPNPRGIQFQDRAGSVRMVTAHGKRFYMEIGSDQGYGKTTVYCGKFGQLFIDELAGFMHISVREEASRHLPTTRYGAPVSRSTLNIPPLDPVQPTRAVVESLLSGAGYPSGEDGRLAITALVAAYVSHERGNVAVRLDEQLPRERTFPWA